MDLMIQIRIMKKRFNDKTEKRNQWRMWKSWTYILFKEEYKTLEVEWQIECKKNLNFW
jgi:hypothetical protein